MPRYLPMILAASASMLLVFENALPVCLAFNPVFIELPSTPLLVAVFTRF